MRLKEGLVIRELGGKYVAVATGKLSNTFHGIIRLNETGYTMMNLLKEDISKEQLINKLLEVYRTKKEDIEIDVNILIKNLKDNNLLDE